MRTAGRLRAADGIACLNPPPGRGTIGLLLKLRLVRHVAISTVPS